MGEEEEEDEEKEEKEVKGPHLTLSKAARTLERPAEKATHCILLSQVQARQGQRETCWKKTI